MTLIRGLLNEQTISGLSLIKGWKCQTLFPAQEKEQSRPILYQTQL